MPRTEAQQAGITWEKRLAEMLGGKLQPGSGNKFFARSDVAGKGILASAKANPTTRRAWFQTRRELAEAVDYAAGTGDIPLLALKDEDGEEFVVMRMADFVGVLTGVADGSLTIPESKGEAKRRTADTPLLLR